MHDSGVFLFWRDFLTVSYIRSRRLIDPLTSTMRYDTCSLLPAVITIPDL